MRAILVFGGTGFLGSSLVNYLLAKRIKIIIYKHRTLGHLKKKKSNNLIIIKSLNKKFLKKFKVQTIYHLASSSSSSSNMSNDFYEANIGLTRKIIFLAKYLKVKQFIYISTGSVFSKKIRSNTFDEKSLPTPNSLYGLFKYTAEKVIEIELKNSNIKTCIIRFPSIFGTNNKEGIVYHFYKLAKKNKQIEVYNNGKNLRNLIYINSAVELMFLAFKNIYKLENHEIFMAGSKNSLKVLDIAKQIVRITKSKSKIKIVKKSSPSDFDVKINTFKAQKILGFKPLSINKALKKFIDNEN